MHFHLPLECWEGATPDILLMEEILHHLGSHYLQSLIHPKCCRISEPSTVERHQQVCVLCVVSVVKKIEGSFDRKL